MTDAPEKQVRSRRVNAWWEPTYSPDIAKDFLVGDWALPERAAHQKLFQGSDLVEAVSARRCTTVFRGIRFTSCDFTGAFEIGFRTIVFDECQFINCDFGTSTWKKAKFTECTFRSCSLTQSTWIMSEFRGCIWSEIGMSGNETDFEQVFIENPRSFLAAAYTRLDGDILSEKGRSAKFQRTRLEETKATVSRNIYNNHKLVGGDEAFYDSCRAYIMQSCRANISDSLYTLFHGGGSRKKRFFAAVRGLGALFEISILWLFGTCNAWGRSVTRPLAGLLLTYFGFSAIYVFCLKVGAGESLGRALDVTTIAGFTRSVLAGDAGPLLWTSWANLVVAIMFYTVFFATVVAKISRNR